MAPSTVPVLPPSRDLPITLKKGTRSSQNPHPIYNFLIYHHLYASYFVVVSTFCYVPLSKKVHEALSHPGWKQATIVEMVILNLIISWNIVSLCHGKSPLCCHWVYTIKIDSVNQVDRLRAHLVANG